MKTELEGNILMDSKIAMDSVIAAMDQMSATSSEETAEACRGRQGIAVRAH